ncbi:hypothetical protein IFM89_022660 [Coptis chinensis]|uniref:Uncharacterized protein n=1 Tax=Coptis chinensis TaxID=261450 RepID=A0A835H5R2_9MAGN|nr:hypothetical protein IFM89_022660 [Coptis chinensis]
MCVDFKAMIEKYYEEDHEESIPLIYEAILRRKLLKKHEDSDNELMEEIMEKPRVRKLPDVKSESESDSADNCAVTDAVVKKRGIRLACRSQAQSALANMSSSGGGVKYGGPMDVAMQVLRSEGGMIGLFKGLAPTFEHEVPGNAAI